MSESIGGPLLVGALGTCLQCLSLNPPLFIIGALIILGGTLLFHRCSSYFKKDLDFLIDALVILGGS